MIYQMMMTLILSDEEQLMTLIQAVIMGIIQGLTEFLPVSSSGHLAIFKIMFNVNTDTGIVFDVLLHVGTLIAIFVAFHDDVAELIREGFGLLGACLHNISEYFKAKSAKRNPEYAQVLKTPYRRFVLMILISMIPTGILGIVGSDFVEWAQNSLVIPGICLIITALLLYLADHVDSGEKTPQTAKGIDAFEIGMAQGIATLPGLSRSGTTITACLLCGFERKFAVKFSFLMSIPAVLGAAVLELKDLAESPVDTSEIGYYIIGMLVAAVVGYISIKTMLLIVRKHKFTFFSIYCFLAGVCALIGAIAQFK